MDPTPTAQASKLRKEDSRCTFYVYLLLCIQNLYLFSLSFFPLFMNLLLWCCQIPKVKTVLTFLPASVCPFVCIASRIYHKWISIKLLKSNHSNDIYSCLTLGLRMNQPQKTKNDFNLVIIKYNLVGLWLRLITNCWDLCLQIITIKVNCVSKKSCKLLVELYWHFLESVFRWSFIPF